MRRSRPPRQDVFLIGGQHERPEVKYWCITAGRAACVGRRGRRASRYSYESCYIWGYYSPHYRVRLNLPWGHSNLYTYIEHNLTWFNHQKRYPDAASAYALYDIREFHSTTVARQEPLQCLKALPATMRAQGLAMFTALTLKLEPSFLDQVFESWQATMSGRVLPSYARPARSSQIIGRAHPTA